MSPQAIRELSPALAVCFTKLIDLESALRQAGVGVEIDDFGGKSATNALGEVLDELMHREKQIKAESISATREALAADEPIIVEAI